MTKSDLIEVDLGELNSVKEGHIHINEKRQAGKGEQLIDDDSKFRLVMVGRKVSPDEATSLQLGEETQHTLGQAIFHESDE